jgi:hypothetical protein
MLKLTKKLEADANPESIIDIESASRYDDL